MTKSWSSRRPKINKRFFGEESGLPGRRDRALSYSFWHLWLHSLSFGAAGQPKVTRHELRHSGITATRKTRLSLEPVWQPTSLMGACEQHREEFSVPDLIPPLQLRGNGLGTVRGCWCTARIHAVWSIGSVLVRSDGSCSWTRASDVLHERIKYRV